MRVMVFAPCEQAVIRVDGSIEALRFGFTEMNLKRPPVGMAAFPVNVLLFLELTPAEQGDIFLNLYFLSPDGQRLVDIPITIRPPQPFQYPSVVRNISAGPLVPPASGDYAFVLLSNQNEIARWPVKVNIIE